MLPLTVNPPVTDKSPPIVTSSGKPTVTVAPSLPEPDTISLDVPDIPAT